MCFWFVIYEVKKGEKIIMNFKNLYKISGWFILILFNF